MPRAGRAALLSVSQAGRQRLGLTIIAMAAGVGLVVGWKLFWFLTDDAFIAFRYISNAHLGFGYTWNPPPFQPVEGYTSFLWVALLDLLWRLTGISPPETANVVSLICSGLQLVVVSWLLLRLTAASRMERDRLWWLAWMLAATLSNRTFLAWTSSGLETALFNLLLWVWIAAAVAMRPHRSRWALVLCWSASAAALARPDGWLTVVATFALLTWSWREQRVAFAATWWLKLSVAAPLLLLFTHLFWRRLTYGEWLPNTFRAKSVGPWPQGGAVYLLSFVLEYSLWIWGVVVLLALWRSRRGARWSPGPLVALLVIAAHASYYTWIVGGDHFEYRVYSAWVPGLWLSLAWALDRLGWSARRSWGVALTCVALSWPIPWTHWYLSQPLVTRKQTFRMKVDVAPSFPAPLRAYVSWFDAAQRWLIDRGDCRRHQEHKQFSLFFAKRFPSREEGLEIDGVSYPVLALSAVGIPAWTLPHVVILDRNGLNDRVIANNPPPVSMTRAMAHDRVPPVGYIDCFQPNVSVQAGRVSITPRDQPLTAEAIRECETRDWPASAQADPADLPTRPEDGP